MPIKGWKKDITEVDSFDDLPVNTKDFIRRIEKNVGLEVMYLGVNNDSDEGLIRIMK
jgi:adenylosuccinate synthase